MGRSLHKKSLKWSMDWMEWMEWDDWGGKMEKMTRFESVMGLLFDIVIFAMIVIIAVWGEQGRAGGRAILERKRKEP